jgi:hypothetical protein
VDGAGYGVCSLGGKVAVPFLSPFVNLDREPVFSSLCRPQGLLARRLLSKARRPGNDFENERIHEIGSSDYAAVFDSFGMDVSYDVGLVDILVQSHLDWMARSRHDYSCNQWNRLKCFF